MAERTGTNNPNWKGGQSTASNGYRLLRVGVGHHLADVRGYAYEHRVVAERVVGRPLRKGEHVHHINGNKLDNRPENLEVLSVSHHRAQHRTSGKPRRDPGEASPMVPCKCGCGVEFERYDRWGRPRLYVSGHNKAAGRLLDGRIWDEKPAVTP